MVFMNNCKAAKAVSGAGGKGAGGRNDGSENRSFPSLRHHTLLGKG